MNLVLAHQPSVRDGLEWNGGGVPIVVEEGVRHLELRDIIDLSALYSGGKYALQKMKYQKKPARSVNVLTLRTPQGAPGVMEKSLL